MMSSNKKTVDNKAVGRGTGGQEQKKALEKRTSRDEACLRTRVSLAPNVEPTYFIGGGNGVALIDEALSDLGWRRVRDKCDESFKLRWCELKSAINYHTFREGEQMVNHIPNCQLLTNKMGLLSSLQEYERVCAQVKKRTLRLDFLPETYKLGDGRQRAVFIDTFKEGEMWICKPTGRNQGKGIFLVRSLDELRKSLQEHDTRNEHCALHGKPTKSLNRIIQRYLSTPLLLDGKKFDIRCYMLVASTVPFLILYHKGYLRLSIHKYDSNCDDLIAHLTNQFIQKKDPAYKELKEETAWSMDRFNDYINEKVAPNKGLEDDWVYNTLTNRMRQVMTYCFNAVKHRLHRKIGYFDLYGFDFMVDDEMKIWLIEVNVNPCLATNCKALRDIVPSVVKETINVSVECFEKSRRHRPLLPLTQPGQFDILHCDELRRGGQQTAGPRASSPVKAVTGRGDAPAGDEGRARPPGRAQPAPRSASIPAERKAGERLLRSRSSAGIATVPPVAAQQGGGGKGGGTGAEGRLKRGNTVTRRAAALAETVATSPYAAPIDDAVTLKMSHQAAAREKAGKEGRHSRGS